MKRKDRKCDKVLGVSSSSIIRRTQTVATFKVKLDISLIVKCKAVKYCKSKGKKMRGRAKIRTIIAIVEKGDKEFEKIHILIYQPFPFSSRCPLFLSPPVVPLTLPQLICLSAISHNQKYLFSLPSNSAGLSWSLYFSYSLFSRRSLSIYLTESLCLYLGLISTPLCLPATETKNCMFSLFFYSSLWHHTISKEYINISSPGTQSRNSIHTLREMSAAQYLSSV